MKKVVKNRFIAILIDLFILLLIVYLIAILENGFKTFTNVPINSITFIIVFYSYFILIEYYTGRSIGKRIMKISIYSNIDKKKSLLRVFFRNIFNLIELIIPIIYIIPVLIWNKKIGDFIINIKLKDE